VTEIYVPHSGWLSSPGPDQVLQFLREGWFEYREQAFLWLFLRPGDTFVDCGAHLGLFSMLAGRAMHDRGTIVSVEPNPALQASLRQNLANNGISCATVIEGAVHSTTGRTTIHFCGGDMAAYSGFYAGEGNSARPAEVQAWTVDDLLDDAGIERTTFLKLDVEGAEIDVLTGCTRSIEAGRLPVVAVEFSEKVLNSAGRTTAQLADAWRDLGYELYRIDFDARKMVPAQWDGPLWYDNLYATNDVAMIEARLANPPPEATRIARDILARGVVAQRLYDDHEAAKKRNEVLSNQVLNSDWARAQIERLESLLKGLLSSAGGPVTTEDGSRNLVQASTELRTAIAALATEGAVESGSDAAASDLPELSIIVCTHNPKIELLRTTMLAIAAQDLERTRFETIVVDNVSHPALSVAQVSPDPTLDVQLIVEPQLGHTFARLAGIRRANAPIILFVDDDNVLEQDYASRALRIAAAEPEVGAFSGVATGVFESEFAAWKKPLLPYLGVRDYGPEIVTSKNDYWGEWDPIGAGMVVRRDIAEHYINFVTESVGAGKLGRRGNSLMSADDTLMARCANQLGYACSYQPSLRLDHHIDPGRLDTRYLKRLLEGHGRSFVVLEKSLGRAVAPVARWAGLRMLFSRYFYRLFKRRRAGMIEWHWDIGYIRASRGQGGGSD